ncbi:MAG: hypothetical protein WC788_03540 [Candidatus Paceibacterota bacterium]|jgi:hypothetical protein
MAKTKLELCRDLDSVIKEIDKGIEGLPEETGRIIRKRLVESVYETDKPDAYYPTRNRIINVIMYVLTLVLVIETIVIYALRESHMLNADHIVYIFGATFILLFFVPNSDKLTEKILRSDNLTLRKIFIPQKN